MAYIDQAYMILAFGESQLIDLTDRDGSAGAIVSAVLGLAIDQAEATVNSYVAKQYDLPLDPVPEALRTWSADIARYRLYTDACPEEIKARYQQTIEELKSVAAGDMPLGDETPADTSDQAQRIPRAVIGPGGRRLTHANLRGI